MFGLGVLLLVIAVGLRWYVAPTATKIPYDLDRSTSIAEAKNATYLQVTEQGPAIHTGDLRSSTDVVPQPELTVQQMTGDLKGKAVVWDVYSQTTASDGSVVDASSEELAIDRVSGAAAPWAGAWENSSDLAKGQETKTEFKGNSYKMPFHAKKTSYDFWDGTLGKTFPAKFQAVDKVEGLEVYRYQQVIPLQRAPLDPGNAAYLASSLAPPATIGELYYSNTRTLWVEPVTGQFLDVREQRHVELRTDTGEVVTLLDADFNYSDSTIKDTVKSVKKNRNLIMMASVWLPIIFAMLGLALIVFAFLVMRRDPERAYRSGGAHADDRAARQMA